MKRQIGKFLILYSSIILMNTAYANTTSTSVSAALAEASAQNSIASSPPKKSETSVNKLEASTSAQKGLLPYLNQVLTEAGFPDDTRNYLLNIARPQLTNIDPADLADKTRLLKRNLYIFLNSMSQKCQSPAASDEVRKQYYLADTSPEPWNNILSPKVLAKFKEKHIFESLSVKDIKNCGFTFCQVWPFCEN